MSTAQGEVDEGDCSESLWGHSMIHALGFARHTAAVTVDPGLIIGFVPLDQTKSELSGGFGKKLDNNAQIWTQVNSWRVDLKSSLHG